MRVAAYTQYGPPEVVAIAERPEPAPGAGRVRVRVHAAPVGSSDAAGRSGADDYVVEALDIHRNGLLGRRTDQYGASTRPRLT